MRQLIVTRGLPILLLLMAIAVILILSGAAAVGFTFGLVVTGLAGVVLVTTALHDVARGDDRPRPRGRYLYRGPSRSGY